MSVAAVGKRDVPGNKIGAGIIWAVGTYMTYSALDQMSSQTSSTTLMLAVCFQIVFTLGQSPVWRGKGNIIGYTCLALDAIANFGGVMSFMVDFDKVGSVQSLAATFLESSSEMPLFIKGILGLFLSGIIAGLPEYLWKLD